MNVFEEILLLPGAALPLADKLSGRIIGRVTDGFDEDPALGDMMNLYRAIEDKWPDYVLSLREMFDLQLKSALKDTEASQAALDGLSEAQREVWMSEQTRKLSRADKLREALPKIVDLYAAAQANSESWEDLTVINQWSLLNATERAVHNRLRRYQSWAKTDEEKGRTETDAIRLRDDTDDAIQPLYELVTAFLSDPGIAKSLSSDSANGIRVPERLTA